MIIDLEAYRRAHPPKRNPEADSTARMSFEWFRLLFVFEDCRRYVCPRCRQYLYYDDEAHWKAIERGGYVACLDCHAPVWRIFEEVPDLQTSGWMQPWPVG